MRWLTAASAALLVLVDGPSSGAQITCGKRARPKLEQGVVSITGSREGKTSRRLPPEVVQRVVRASFGTFRQCYEAALGPCPNLSGRVVVRFVIQPSGKVTHVDTKGSGMPDATVARCVGKRFEELTFPSFDGPPIRVTYPVAFSPTG